jgi:excinuclease ABC subunit A
MPPISPTYKTDLIEKVMSQFIQIKNARVNNLKNVSAKIPKNKLTVITGMSGSGKSSLAFDTIYAEGQRRYAESLNAYARQFMDVQDKPDVDEITGLSPTIAIDQRNIAQNPRSTVGTVTEIYDYLRLLFARIGRQYDPETNKPVEQYTDGQIVEIVRQMARKSENILILAPILVDAQDISHKDILRRLEASGYESARINGVIMSIASLAKYHFQKDRAYTIELLVGRVVDVKKQQLAP